MNGLETIMEGIRELMKELFGEVDEQGGVLRSLVQHLGVTDAGAVVEAVPTGGLDRHLPYPVLHFHITLAKNVPSENADNLCRSLNDLNNVIAVGDFPCFGNFAYYPRLNQIYLSYRMPVNVDAPDAELVNISYYFDVLYRQMDLFADYILYLCDNDGRALSMGDYLDYLSQIRDLNDIEERIKLLEKKLEEFEKSINEE